MTHVTQVSTSSDTELLITRRFEAPARLVFECLSKPEYIRQWMLGPDGWTMPVCDIDFRVDGKYRYEWVNRDDSLCRVGMSGTFREIKAPSRIVATERFDHDWTDGETSATTPLDTLNTTTLTEKAGTTTLEIRVKYASQKARDGALASGMTEGMEAGFKRLEDVLAAVAH